MGSIIKIVIGIVVVVVLAVVAVSLLTGGDDDEPKSAQNKAEQSGDKKSSDSDSGSDSDSDGSEPDVKTVATKRVTGLNATTNVSALMRSPEAVYVRVSAAPKQEVTVNWSLSCNDGAVSQGAYDATPPDTRQLKLPKNAKTCVASAGSQAKGKNTRLKLAILRDR